jgi:hypothetical protein
VLHRPLMSRRVPPDTMDPGLHRLLSRRKHGSSPVGGTNGFNHLAAKFQLHKATSQKFREYSVVDLAGSPWTGRRPSRETTRSMSRRATCSSLLLQSATFLGRCGAIATIAHDEAKERRLAICRTQGQNSPAGIRSGANLYPAFVIAGYGRRGRSRRLRHCRVGRT